MEQGGDAHCNHEHQVVEAAAPQASDEVGGPFGEQSLRTIISWGRYAECFAYDDNRQAFSLENPA